MSPPGLSREERRAGRDKSKWLEVLGSAQRKPELGSLGEGWGREAEALPGLASTPRSIRKLLRNYSLPGPEPSPAEVPGSRW